ncbi:MAG: FAD:protein FMN transferase [Tannerella sp.]|jgi:thiamine biosynthesis lipoprotein|nr:FAD:protein FMN transferase [Tannerella sp.]
MYTNFYPSSRLFHGSIPKVMGTRLDALLLGDGREGLEALWDEIAAETFRLEKMLNRFDPESALGRLNAAAAVGTVAVEDELWSILMECGRYRELTEGCFDIALGRWAEVTFDVSARTVRLGRDAFFDLGGYAKGYAAQRIGDILVRHGVTRALVNFGDSMALGIGTHPHGCYWPAGIDNPYTGRRLDEIRLCDAALSVSGNMPGRPAHIVRPATGRCVEGRRIVAVAAPHPVDAEVLTTALMAAGDGVAAWSGRFEIYECKVYDC